MHPDFKKADRRSHDVIGAAIEVHRMKGPGLIESIYERCFMHELDLRKIPAVQQVMVPIEYKGIRFDEPLKLDVYVDDCLMVELKAVEQVFPIHKAQLMTYMKPMNAPLGLLINFHETPLTTGVSRMILPGANNEN